MKPLLMPGLLLAFFSICLISCDGCRPEQPPKVSVHAELENVPPIAGDVNIQVLDNPIKGKNVLFTAAFPPGEIDSIFLAVMVGDEKVVLRDDGKEGDAQANDRVFSVLLQEDLIGLGNELSGTARLAEGLINQKKSLLRFSGRTAEAVNLDETFLSLIREPLLKTGRRFPLGVFAGGGLIPADPLLKDHSLMITDLKVVEDPDRTFNPCNNKGNPNGVWTFGHLMKEMANGSMSVEDFTRKWLQEWLQDVTVNGDVIRARTQLLSDVIEPWIISSGGSAPVTLANWTAQPLDITKAPFKLTAIVNRMDLGGNRGYGRSNAGEGRFVFSVIGCSDNGSFALPFNIIFEYGLPLIKCEEIRDYAKSWIDLKTMTVGSAAYNSALESITKVFTRAGASPSRVNGSALNQLRTNEIQLGRPWELREFVLDSTLKTLKSATVKQEPAKIYNRASGGSPANLALLADWVNTHQSQVIQVKHTVPLTLSGGRPFLGGKAHTETRTHFWDAVASPGPDHIVDNEARHKFSLTTCSGCHGGEADTQKGGFIGSVPGFSHPPFVHVAFVPFGVQATLSGFLIGDPSQVDNLFMVNDPTGRGGPRGFNDLEDRARKLEETAKRDCSFKPFKSIELAKIVQFRSIAMMEH